jgi:hypothetical protein
VVLSGVGAIDVQVEDWRCAARVVGSGAVRAWERENMKEEVETCKE